MNIGDTERDIGYAKQRDETDGNKGAYSSMWMWNNILRGTAKGEVPAGSTRWMGSKHETDTLAEGQFECLCIISVNQAEQDQLKAYYIMCRKFLKKQLKCYSQFLPNSRNMVKNSKPHQ